MRRTCVAALVTGVSVAFLASCGDDEAAPRLTLTDTDCTYEGSDTYSSTETFDAEIVNESSELGAFEIARIDPGHTFAEVEAYMESERQRLGDGLEIAGPPAFMTLGARAQAAGGETGTLVSIVTPGTWTLWCAQNHPPSALFLIAPPLTIS
jgi:hypothetical protein